MKFRIQRYDPDKDAKPYFQDYDLEMGPADRMLLDGVRDVVAAFHTAIDVFVDNAPGDDQ